MGGFDLFNGQSFPDESGVIGDESVDALGEESAGAGGIVDGVTPDAKAVRVSGGGGGGAQVAVPDEEAYAGGGKFGEGGVIGLGERPRGDAGSADVRRTEGAEDLLRKEGVKLGEELPVEGLDDDAVDEVVFAEEASEGGGIADFAFDQGDGAVGGDLGDGIEEQREALTGADVEGLEFGEGFVGDPETAGAPAGGSIGGAIKRSVVDDEEGAVGRVMIVEFDEIGAGEGGEAEGGESVFRSGGGVAAVANDEGAGATQEIFDF